MPCSRPIAVDQGSKQLYFLLGVPSTNQTISTSAGVRRRPKLFVLHVEALSSFLATCSRDDESCASDGLVALPVIDIEGYSKAWSDDKSAV